MHVASLEERQPRTPPRIGWWAPRSDLSATWQLLAGSWGNLLLICLPLGYAAHAAGWNPVATFVLNLVALIPTAWLLGCVTEDLGAWLGYAAGGVLNATFGNAPELILSIIALVHGLDTVALTSLVGSVLSNLLLVLGCCFFVGGLTGGRARKHLEYSAAATSTLAAAMLAAALLVGVPSAAHATYGDGFPLPRRLILSHSTAILLIVMYAVYLVHALYTHRAACCEDDEDLLPRLSVPAALLALGAITVLVAFSSQFLVASLRQFSARSGLSQAFLGLIILPVASNATDHMTSVLMACRGKMDLAFGCSLGSALQVAALMLPVLVLVGWGAGRPFTMELDLSLMLTLSFAAVLVAVLTKDGRSDYLQGALLLVLYCAVAVCYGLLPAASFHAM